MVLDCPDIQCEIHHGVPRMGEAHYQDLLDSGWCGLGNVLAFAMLMFNGYDIQQQPCPAADMWL